MSNTSQITSPRLVVMFAGIGILLVGSLLLLAQGVRAQTGTEPVLSSITSVPSDTGATINWTTDQAANGQVVYGTTSGGENAQSTLSDTGTGTTTHMSFLGGLTPNTTYFYEVVSQLVGSTTNTFATSSEQTFMTTNTASTTTTAASSTPVLSAIVASTTDTTATITWTSDVNATSQILYGLTNGYGNMSTLQDTGTGVMNHSVLLVGLTPNTTYHFAVQSFNGTSPTASSSDMIFTTTNTASTTGNTGSTTTDFLQSEINALQTRVAALEAFIAGLGGNTGTGSTTPPTTGGGTGTIDQSGATVNSGGSIDLSGRNFGHEENVIVTLNGSQVASAHADGGGNFSTGSFAAPTTAGTYTYTFTGQSSGITGTATITVQ